jgi:uncharacterized protein (DUF736 family)
MDQDPPVYDDSNRGVLFPNTRKTTDRHPDLTGRINIGGVEYWLSGWYKTSNRTGQEFLSLSLGNEVEQQQPVQQQPVRRQPQQQMQMRPAPQRQPMQQPQTARRLGLPQQQQPRQAPQQPQYDPADEYDPGDIPT